jgi:BlaR1 peptidase M56
MIASPQLLESLEIAGGLFAAFVLHATVLLALVWSIERLGGLKHPAWAELAWRLALFGAFVSVTVESLPELRGASHDAPAMSAVASAPNDLPSDASLAIPITANTNDIGTDDRTQAPSAAPTPSSHASIQASSMQAPSIRQASVQQASTQQASSQVIASPAAVTWPQLSLSMPHRALFAALALWLLGMSIMSIRAMRQIAGLRRLRRRLGRDGIAADAALQQTTARLARAMGMRAPALSLMPGIDSPLVLANIVLLPRWAEGLDPRQRTAMLAHELAHLRRRDPWWRPLQRLALVPLFFHPLAWRAVRRLEALAETLCDRAALEHGDGDGTANSRSANGRALAECLAECLARRQTQTGIAHNPMWAVAMAGQSAEHADGIVARVRNLLENPQMKLATIPARWRWTAAGFALLLLIALPGVLLVARDDRNSLSITMRDGGSTQQTIASMSGNGERLRVEIDGKVEFNADETDVARLGSGAAFEIEHTIAGKTRELRIENSGGRIVRSYEVDGAARPYDADARAWFAARIPQMYRLTGLQAEARTQRLLAAGGVPRVLKEIAAITGDFARAEYIAQLLTQATPNAAEYAELTTLTDAIDSDFETRRALDALLAKVPSDAQAQARLLAIARDMGSDFERAEWLSQAAARLPLEGEPLVAWAGALHAFGSDFEHRRVLERLIADGRPRAQAVAVALTSMRRMSSDFEIRSALEKAADSGVPLTDAAYLGVVDAMGSDFERREALMALIEGASPDVDRSRAILRSARGIGSEFECGAVLAALAAKMPNDPALIEDYRAVARGLGDHERGQAEKALDRFYAGS